MPFSRAAAARTARQLRAAQFRQAGPTSGQWHRAGRRTYSSASETAEKAKEGAKKGASFLKQSELPWLIGAAAVTIPGTYLILANAPTGEAPGLPGSKWHGHEEHEEEEEGEEEDGASEGEDDKEEDGGDEEKAESKDEGPKDESEGEQDKQEAGEEKDQPSEKPESKSGKDDSDAKSSGESEQDGEDGDSKKTKKPDAKGGVKRRVESAAGKKQGEAEDDDDTDHVTSGMPEKEGNMQSKQKGISNTDTKHSYDIGNDPNVSKKAKGTPDTAKVQGTVDPSRPAV